MSSTPTPTQTPNVLIRSPRIREIVYDVFGWVGLGLAAVVTADSFTEAFDVTAWTTPALQVFAVVGAGIGYVAQKNTPSLS